ncbi:hypothetical protein ABIA32_005399 [Streptacidiphilus sp. MAP12-20]|uniref:PP2C family protein-serine/threonine phosphatase n=1 Tax=Streptacidiphilus sp. MAP12-20 TaxID=3156299 RepID=UPI00351284D9
MPARGTAVPLWTTHLGGGRIARWSDRALDGDPRAERQILCLLALLSLGLAVLAVVSPDFWPPSTQTLPLVLGGLLLRTRLQLLLIAVVAVGITADALWREPYGVRPGSAVVLGETALIMLIASRFSGRLGVRGNRGSSVLLELAYRTRELNVLPDLGPQWRIDQALVPTGGLSFSGDLLLTRRHQDTGLFEALLVDVSGKGSRAAARSLHLSGAFAALLGSVRPEQLLPAANRYMLRLDWQDEFATAVHLALDPASGDYQLFNAGHPPPGCHTPGTGWTLLHDAGPALGLLPDMAYPASTGRLDVGMTLLLYSDGLVEVPGEDLDLGIRRLLDAATPLLSARPPQGIAATLLQQVAGDIADDRSLLVVQRERPG